MPAKKQPEYTPVEALRGSRVHAVAFGTSNRTMCNRAFSGWKASLKKLNCRACKLEILKVRVGKRVAE